MRLKLLSLLCCPLLEAKPTQSTMFSSSAFEPKDGKFNFYQNEMEELLDQPYFAKVNNKTRVNLGEAAYLPCRLKNLRDGFTVSQKIYFDG